MPFAKPYNYVDATVLSATGQDSNETAAKCYINNKIVPGDIAQSSYDFDSIQKGELDPITNHYRFATGDIYGRALPNEPLDRSYFTSNVKAVNQTGDAITVWLPTYETATTFELEYTATIMITFGATYISNSNVEQAHGRWDSKCLLRYNNGTSWQNLDGTRAFTFEENTAASAGTRDPASSALSAYSKVNDVPERGFRRYMCYNWIISNLAPGSYQFVVAVNTKSEEGYCSARTFTCEVFYT